jgi:hypothetical protein
VAHLFGHPDNPGKPEKQSLTKKGNWPTKKTKEADSYIKA